MNPPSRTALITGASSGIGEAFADVFGVAGFNLVITARREDRLRQVATRIEEQHRRRVEVITGDFTERDASERLCAEIASRGLAIDALVNSAGYGLPGSYVKRSWTQHQTFLQIMLIAVAELTYLLLPGMIERGYGRIINVSSLAGLVPASPGHTLYAPTKAFLIRFSEGLAQEVASAGVHVTAVCPGFTVTEFHDVSGTRAMVRRIPSFMWMDANSVARQGFEAVMAGRSVHVPGRVNTALATLARLLPQPLVRRINRRTVSSYRRI